MRVVALATVVALGVTACAGADDGDDSTGGGADQTASTTASTTDAPGTTTTTASTTEPPTVSSTPEGAVVRVPVDLTLLTLAPDLPGERKVDEDDSFDTRLCDGSVPPDVPAAQAAVTYDDGAQVTTVGLYRFDEGDPYRYLEAYRDAVGVCSTSGRTSVEPLDIGPEGAYLIGLDTVDTVGLVILAVTYDVLWVVYRRSAEATGFTDQDLFALDEALFLA